MAQEEAIAEGGASAGGARMLLMMVMIAVCYEC